MSIVNSQLSTILTYATDASAYRELPLGVAYPQNEQDIRDLLAEARKRNTHLIPRAAGTSIAGQVVGSGIVVDISRYMNRVLEINPEERWVRVQPGVVRDELNIALKPYGLFFSPETSTSNRCCIGGMVGNNSCGTHSLVYGSTRHHVLALKGILADGTSFSCTTSDISFETESRVGQTVLDLLQSWRQNKHIRQLLADNFPDASLRRRSCGYALDECLAGENVNLPALLTGSEGTLAFITEIALSLDPVPKPSFLVVQKLDNMDDAWQANLDMLKLHPTAVELIDGEILRLAQKTPVASRYLDVLHLDSIPSALLVAEFENDQLPTVNSQLLSPSTGEPEKAYQLSTPDVWALRKAGLGVLTGTDSDAKPVGVIEDTAVAPERLADYMHDFRAMMGELGLSCIYYGHISTGELHLRPILNLKLPKDRKLFREVAERTARLVKKHHGSLSGEHGDGRLRGEFIPLMYGDEVYDLFCQIKDAFDPEGLLNVEKIVRTPPMDKFLRYDLSAQRSDIQPRSGLTSLLRRIERCNGSGDCRKSNLIGGTMCPAYKVSGDELMTTRARANILRELLFRGKLDKYQLSIINEQLSSCLACKACRSECPSNVDMTRIRSQVLQLIYNKTYTPFRTWMVARMASVERLGSLVPRIYNWFATNRLTSYLLKKLLHFATERRIPTLSRHTMRQLIQQQSASIVERSDNQQHSGLKKVYLFCDEFTNYQEAELGLMFACLLQRLGYEVIVPKHVESGRAAISKGCLHLAARYAKRNVELLSPFISEETSLVGIEPSCILSFRDEYPDLMPNEALRTQVEALAPNCLLFDEFLCREIDAGRIDPTIFKSSNSQIFKSEIFLHGHCHQKALVGVEKTARLLQYTTSGKVHIIPSGCCGMAGSFGYEAEHYATSMAIGEMVLFPAIRKAVSAPSAERSNTQQHSGQTTLISAPGTSCREHIRHATGVTALHPIEILYAALS